MGLITLRNRLSFPVFPGGLAALNTAHPMAQGARYAGVATGAGGGIINLLSGKPATVNGTIAGSVAPLVGPVSLGSGSGAFLSQAATNEKPTAVTMAAIIIPTSTTLWSVFNNNGSTHTSTSVEILGSGGSLNPQLLVGAGLGAEAPITLTLNVPYFLAFSYNGTTGYSVTKNLKTGVVSTFVTTNTRTFGTPTASQYAIGGDSGLNQSNAKISAVAYSINNALSMQQLLLWAQAPWDYWYPPTMSALFSTALAPSIAAIPANPTGVAATGAAGSVSAQTSDSVPLAGVAATGAAGAVSTQGSDSVPLAGVAATGAAGSISAQTSDSVPLAGVAATGAAGAVSVLSGTSVAPVGVESAGVAGSVAAQTAQSIGVVGVAATGAAGVISFTHALIGVAAAGRAGSLVVAVAHDLPGVTATGAAGSLASVHFYVPLQFRIGVF